jgi:hypothetical protein
MLWPNTFDYKVSIEKYAAFSFFLSFSQGLVEMSSGFEKILFKTSKEGKVVDKLPGIANWAK